MEANTLPVRLVYHASSAWRWASSSGVESLVGEVLVCDEREGLVELCGNSLEGSLLGALGNVETHVFCHKLGVEGMLHGGGEVEPLGTKSNELTHGPHPQFKGGRC